MSDENLAKLALNELDPVKAFMSGHIRLKGNPMLTQKLDILFKVSLQYFRNCSKIISFG